jgi:hypothetical protein
MRITDKKVMMTLEDDISAIFQLHGLTVEKEIVSQEDGYTTWKIFAKRRN